MIWLSENLVKPFVAIACILSVQQIAFKNLVERNRRTERDTGAPDSGSIIRLPFIVVNTSKSTVIDCSISDDK